MVNTDAKLLALIEYVDKRIGTISLTPGKDGLNGADGKDGRDGRDGRDGVDGADGVNGKDGLNGKDGVDGKDGLSVVNVQIDIDDHLVVTLSDGSEIDAGELPTKTGGDRIQVSTVHNTTGGDGRTWIEYASNWSSEPVFVETIAAGDVYLYTYLDGTLYRLVPSGGASDAFYTTFNSPTLTGQVAVRGMTINS